MAMFGDDVIVHTRLIPPRLPRRWLRRSRLDQLLAISAEHPLTLVRASAGYGKSSVLASFAARGGWPTAWYTLSAVDDPLVFLLHLIHTLRTVAPRAGTRAIALLEQRHGTTAWNQALDSLINDLVTALDDETMLVLDDYHTVDAFPEIRTLIERLILQRPPQLHVLLSTRIWPHIASLPILQARGELFEISETDLAFTPDEIGELFAAAYEYALSAREAQTLHTQTGGWAIALQLLSQSTQTQSANDNAEVNRLLGQSAPPNQADEALPDLSREALFAYLAQDVLAGQPEDIQHFLLRSSALLELTPTTCDHVLSTLDSDAWLQTLYRRGLFLISTNTDVYRYHPLFQAFLQQRARTTLPEWATLHARAAAYYRETGADELMLHHLAVMGDDAQLAQELERLAPIWLADGRLVTLLTWLDHLPDSLLMERPTLLLARGDAARLLARFDDALHAYTEAERGADTRGVALDLARALQGQAQVYLDTVQPIHADALLRRAFKLIPNEECCMRSEVLRLIAENRLNSGRADQAARLYRAAERVAVAAQGAAHTLRVSVFSTPAALPDDPQPRVLLRLGKLAEARDWLEANLVENGLAAGSARSPEAHREVTLLLALISALQGDSVAALRYAQKGVEIARQSGSALSEAAAYIRMGHALQLGPTPDSSAANSQYLQAMTLADSLGVQRTKAEAYLGFALLHGFAGDVEAARAAAHAGLALVEQSGDAWTAALLWTALGAVGGAMNAPDAETWLTEGLNRFRAAHDTFGQAVAHLWLTIMHQRAGAASAAARHAHETLTLVFQHGYQSLLTRLTLLGPRDRMMPAPILLAGRSDPQWSKAAQSLFAQGFPALNADETIQHYHPGSTLRITLFERLRVWRGNEEVEARAWQRKKAHQLMALLLTNRHRWLLREQICDALWPDDSKADAEAHFKVTLNALNAALEPMRPPRTPPFYVRRQGSAYRFAPPEGVWLDVEEFERRIDIARIQTAAGTSESLAVAQIELLEAVGLYRGDYLSEYLYEEWTREERDRLLAQYLDAATTLADLLLQHGRPAESIRICDSILARDPSWEQAYGVLMRAYVRIGNRRLALATYERCVRNLRDTLDVAPLPQTTEIYEAMKG